MESDDEKEASMLADEFIYLAGKNLRFPLAKFDWEKVQRKYFSKSEPNSEYKGKQTHSYRK